MKNCFDVEDKPSCCDSCHSHGFFEDDFHFIPIRFNGEDYEVCCEIAKFLVARGGMRK